ncbi:MAG: M15 family metallopeptidase [Bacteroidota bacterium]
MKRAAFPLICLFALLIAACGGETASDAPNRSPSDTTPESPVADAPVAELPFEPDAIYLERMYATSIGKAGPEAALDGDSTTWWEAMPGAGENEGIMLYFAEPTYISQVRIALPQQEARFARNIEFYADGTRIPQVGSLEAPVSLDRELRALFIRVAATRGNQELTYYIDDGEGQIAVPNPDQQVGIAEIFLSGKDGEGLKLRPLPMVPGKAQASSILEPAAAYAPDFLFDSRMEFGWAEGKTGSGNGETVQFSFARKVRIEKIKVWNGYQRSEDHFSRNERAQTIRFAVVGGSGAELTLKDESAAQAIALPEALEGTEFELKVNSVYPGKAYDDLVISELRFFDGKRWFGLQDAGAATREQSLLTQCQNSPLAGAVNRPIVDEWSTAEDAIRKERSLLLRSNGSFVLYLNDYENFGTKMKDIRQVADGGWEIIEANAERARVKIFGKIHRVRDKIDIYKGTSTRSTTRIFSEFLTITADMVKGEKLLDSARMVIRDHDLVPCNKYLNDGRVELRYATDNNFMEQHLYSECLPCMAREDAAKALRKAEEKLNEIAEGAYILHIWDAYRPYSVQKYMWEEIQDPRYVADPYNGGSSHNKGAAFDLTLAPIASDPDETVPMGTDFDYFGEEAHRDYAGLSEEAANNRKLLQDVMEHAGFKPFATEWWHFNYPAANLKIIDVNQECDI